MLTRSVDGGGADSRLFSDGGGSGPQRWRGVRRLGFHGNCWASGGGNLGRVFRDGGGVGSRWRRGREVMEEGDPPIRVSSRCFWFSRGVRGDDEDVRREREQTVGRREEVILVGCSVTVEVSGVDGGGAGR
ncbi:hypothetical protein QJS04_geneDACA013930 [Acorus gramineus]|uniref:Uncharacterized protein n=1 Tax=Acorus gramineus TaxID=55184 RepID=A0AAV9AV14_ACOGR|nr:hypothetical protein QJS04_geneDACA013930 [Acorus gramineus]